MKKINTLTASLVLAPSELYVADVQKMTKYYRDSIGLTPLESTSHSVVLGHAAQPIIKLVARPKLAHDSPRSAGLFHNAILFSSK